MYLINELAKIASISTRTLRYYDQIGLLKPSHTAESGYRMYDENQVDQLQQILIYKRLGFDLKQIKSMLYDAHFDETKALESHLTSLEQELKDIKTLINTVRKTINHQKGGLIMTDQDKFEGLKEKQIQDNESTYGKEIREKYGDQAVDESNKKLKSQSKQDYDHANQLSIDILNKLKEALLTNDPTSDIAQEVCQMHQSWIKLYWPTYRSEAHLALVNMYLTDERFKAYYEKVGEGATQLLVNAMTIYLNKE